MKTIGIKLADGSFYPILQEGTVKTYQLDLTTVKDGQTKVQIDLYRSATGTMDDAEYVDTLEVTNLVPHPNGEVELHLSVGLNENNELDAKVVDEETGEQSETNVTLVSRTLAERSEPTNFELSEETPDLSLPEETETPAEVPAEESNGLTADSAEDALADFSFDDFKDDENQQPQDEPVSQAEELTEDVEEVPFSFDSEIAAEQREGFSEESVEEAPVFEEPAAEPVEVTPVEEPAAEPVEVTPVEEPAAETETFDLPDFDDSEFNSTETAVEETPAVEPATEPAAEEFNLPDFDDSEFNSTENTSEEPEAAGLTGYFDDPAFKEDPVFTETDLDTASNDDLNFDTSDLDSSSTDSSSFNSNPMDFSDLYDKETLNGENSSYDEEEEEEKKTRVPMIICIICAIICIIATILVLFFIPSKYNLIKSRNTREAAVIENTVKEVTPPPVEEVIEESAPVEAEPEAPAAIEDEIVVAPEPDVVVPVPEPAPEPEKKADVKYRIRWGDTLWDIADAYYKNPWRYPKIAKYNKIKNPDLIISGTDILIPQE